jgi:hypothetical protein
VKTAPTPTVEQARTAPDAIRSLTTMTSPDYVDLFTVTAPGASDGSAEQWARSALERASRAGRFIAWQVLCGLRLETHPSPDRVAGWKVAAKDDNWIRLEASSWFMTAHAVVYVEDDRVSVALFIRYDRAAGALVWSPISVIHRQLMPAVLQAAARRMSRGRRE